MCCCGLRHWACSLLSYPDSPDYQTGGSCYFSCYSSIGRVACGCV